MIPLDLLVSEIAAAGAILAYAAVDQFVAGA
jgi:hypothetical protein